MGRSSPFSFSSQELSLGNEEQLSIFIPGAFLGEWRAALHFHFLPRNFSLGMERISPFSFPTQELLLGNGEQLSIFIPGAFLGEWRAALHFYPRISRGMGSNSTFSFASQEPFFLSRAALHLDIIHDLTK